MQLYWTKQISSGQLVWDNIHVISNSVFCRMRIVLTLHDLLYNFLYLFQVDPSEKNCKSKLNWPNDKKILFCMQKRWISMYTNKVTDMGLTGSQKIYHELWCEKPILQSEIHFHYLMNVSLCPFSNWIEISLKKLCG